MSKKGMSLFLCCILIMVGCAQTGTMTKSEQGGLFGAGGGAVVGAILGQAIGHNTQSTLIGAAIGAAVGGGGGYGVGAMMDKQEKDMREVLAKSEATAVTREGNLLSVTFKGDVTFDTNSAELRSGLYNEINRVAGVLNQYPDTLIRVEGHTDSKGSDEYNMDLSKRRANNVKTLLVMRGVAENRIEVAGYGKTMPVATNDTEAGRQKNRRVEIRIAPKVQTQTP
ncbi:MAG: OmpA family protein [Smithella sp.]|jgi:outer membrane protein OmpA-like peptidoglycan-associated protein|nr:OmpA family protein [Smithella sp.]